MNEAEPLPYAAQLKALREGLGLSYHAMAELLYTSQQTYRNWEQGSRPRKEASARIERFLASARDQMTRLANQGLGLVGMVPLSVASSMLGIPHETLFHSYRNGGFDAMDLGILGIWVQEESLDDIMDAVLA